MRKTDVHDGDFWKVSGGKCPIPETVTSRQRCHSILNNMIDYSPKMTWYGKPQHVWPVKQPRLDEMFNCIAVL